MPNPGDKDRQPARPTAIARKVIEAAGAPAVGKREIDPSKLNLRRTARAEPDERKETPPQSVSAGAVDKVIDLAFNPSRDKIREVTIIDRFQGRLFPVVDAMNSLYRNCIEIATYRQSKEDYKTIFNKEMPEPIDLMDDLVYRVAQWQKSVAGKNLEKATDIALAETETRAGDEEVSAGGRGYED